MAYTLTEAAVRAAVNTAAQTHSLSSVAIKSAASVATQSFSFSEAAVLTTGAILKTGTDTFGLRVPPVGQNLTSTQIFQFQDQASVVYKLFKDTDVFGFRSTAPKFGSDAFGLSESAFSDQLLFGFDQWGLGAPVNPNIDVDVFHFSETAFAISSTVLFGADSFGESESLAAQALVKFGYEKDERQALMWWTQGGGLHFLETSASIIFDDIGTESITFTELAKMTTLRTAVDLFAFSQLGVGGNVLTNMSANDTFGVNQVAALQAALLGINAFGLSDVGQLNALRTGADTLTLSQVASLSLLLKGTDAFTQATAAILAAAMRANESIGVQEPRPLEIAALTAAHVHTLFEAVAALDAGNINITFDTIGVLFENAVRAAILTGNDLVTMSEVVKMTTARTGIELTTVSQVAILIAAYAVAEQYRMTEVGRLFVPTAIFDVATLTEAASRVAITMAHDTLTLAEAAFVGVRSYYGVERFSLIERSLRTAYLLTADRFSLSESRARRRVVRAIMGEPIKMGEIVRPKVGEINKGYQGKVGSPEGWVEV
jgi:hypothetical protein